MCCKLQYSIDFDLHYKSKDNFYLIFLLFSICIFIGNSSAEAPSYTENLQTNQNDDDDKRSDNENLDFVSLYVLFVFIYQIKFIVTI